MHGRRFARDGTNLSSALLGINEIIYCISNLSSPAFPPSFAVHLLHRCGKGILKLCRFFLSAITVHRATSQNRRDKVISVNFVPSVPLVGIGGPV